MSLAQRRPNLRLPIPSDHLRPPLPPSTSSSTSTSTIALSDLEKLHVLGHGNGGTVYKVRHRRTSSLYALKLLSPTASSDDRRLLTRETDILRRTSSLPSPHVVLCHSVFHLPSGDSAILMEYMDSGTLDTLLRRDGPFPESSLSDVARQVLHGLSYLHSLSIVHRDIKPSNLLVDSDFRVKISDFGVSKVMCRSLDPCTSYVGTCAYMSPERFDPEAYGGNYDGYAADVWSLGLTLLELYLGYFPLLGPGQRPDWATLMCAICFGEPPEIPGDASAEFRSFMECCLQKEAGKRWSVKQLLSHPFVAGKGSELSDL
ncbi:hypothetical protein MLD38_031619 [Melastoma candidum]|uniref:Uncharacterized protein n=1 Tax=Melastoma candidum TaxID=119954 RepID=A0ACB9MPU3_9MYRT|nr:hypothetical protein MLD38_031619 [Melastoma candidum]